MNRFVLLISLATALGLAPVGAAEKPKITSQDQLPRFSYAYQGPVADVATKDEVYGQLAPKVRADLEKLLADYDIQDRTTLQDIHSVLLTMDVQEGRYDDAVQRIGTIRSLEQKPAAKLTAGLLAEAYIAARRAAPRGAALDRTVFQQSYAERINALPWAVVRDLIQQIKGSAEIATEAFVLGRLTSQYQSGVDKTGEISGDVAQALVGARTNVACFLPLKSERVAVLTAYVAAHKQLKPDIWAARNFTLDGTASVTPVTVAVWDSGVDVKLYPQQLWTNPREQENGKDNDGNGFIADVHGIAFTLHSDRTPELLLPLDDAQRARYPEMRTLTKGMLDLRANIESPESTEIKKRMSVMQRDEVKPFIENLGFFGDYTHGTHVAGIATAGNPAARLLVARITFDYRMIPEVPTREQALKDAIAARDTVLYFKAAGVRVVNMSWGGSPRDIEGALEVNGAGGSPEERRKFARELFAIQRDALTEAFKSAPEILFVAAAGNSDSDASFGEYVPSGIVLPNVLTVGAVDQAGDETSFTSFGPNVAVYANGFEVESYLPGGDRMKYSGTSMAAPNVTNLAAKLLALDPTLSPEQLIALIKLGAERRANGRVNLIHPQRSRALLRARMEVN